MKLLEREARCVGGNWAFASATGETQIQTTIFIWKRPHTASDVVLREVELVLA